MKRVIRASELEAYEVTVSFGGFIGADVDYTVYANNEDEALDEAINIASGDLSIENCEALEDGEYIITVGFGGFIGVEAEYTIFADSADDAEDAALIDARDDLEAELVEE